jgi:hypothetical protein
MLQLRWQWRLPGRVRRTLCTADTTAAAALLPPTLLGLLHRQVCCCRRCCCRRPCRPIPGGGGRSCLHAPILEMLLEDHCVHPACMLTQLCLQAAGR